MKAPSIRWGLYLMVALATCGSASALGTEELGNKPLNDANYTSWPGIMPVVNHPSRVYQQWVNGNELLFYAGDMTALNDTLQKFSRTGCKPLEVVLRPGPGVARTFAQKPVSCQWRLQLMSRVSGYLLSRDRGKEVWPDHPVLTVYVGNGIELEKLVLPAGMQVTSLTTAKLRALGGFKSTDKTVRGWTAGQLVALDPYDEGSRDAIAAMLKDDDNWVRLNAAHSLVAFGKKALPVLPQLRDALATDDAMLREAVRKTIQEIEKAEGREALERSHNELSAQIDQFVAARTK